jgi:ATP-dependent Clp protease ATP-binding subunit ClpB
MIATRPCDGIGQLIISKSGVNASQLEQEIIAEISKYPNTSGDTSTVYISHDLKRLLQQAFSEARLIKDEFVSVEQVFLTISKDKFCDKTFKSVGLTHGAILNSLKKIRISSKVTDPNPESKYSVLEKFCIDLTDRPTAGKLDPVIGRDMEIRRVDQVLSFLETLQINHGKLCEPMGN